MAETAGDDTPNSFASAQQFQNNDGESPESVMEQRQLFPPEDGDPTFIVGAVDVDEGNNNNNNNDERRRRALERLHNLSEDVNMAEVENDIEEFGDGDSNCDAAEFAELNAATASSSTHRLQVLIKNDDNGNNDVLDTEENSIWVSPLGLCPLPEDVSVPKPPDDWELAEPNADVGQPPHEEIDNPGGWCSYSFRPKFAFKASKGIKRGDYLCHQLATGARPVPVNDEGKRKVNDWEFHYQGWKNDGPQKFRSGASSKNNFPEERLGCLDYDLLKKMGLNKTRLLNKDCLFFYQLLFPICDPKKSDIIDDPRCAFYTQCERFTSKYAASIGLGGSYGHHFKPVTAAELLIFDMAVVRDGVLGGSHGAIYRRWKKDSSTYDHEMASAITYSRWLELKRTFKLCDNDLAPKKGQPGYDPAYKYDLPYRCLVKNTNEMTLLADLDLCGDETTCGHSGFGEAGSGILERRRGKPGITFGMQTVLVCDVSRYRIRAYTHRHKLHKWPDSTWGKEGPREVRRITDMIGEMVLGEKQSAPAGSSPRQIFSEKPHSTWDNFFSSDQMMDYLGENGWSATMTCARNRLPAGIPEKYLHKEKTEGSNHYARVGRFNQPITVVEKKTKNVTVAGEMPGTTKNVQRTWTRVHVSFQSTSSTNISTVNALNENQLYTRVKERGRDRNKRRWAIEMNEARDLYLATYGQIDTIDSLVKRCQLYYVSWKYWHACKLHVLALGLVVAYDMYKEVLMEGYSHFGFETKDEAKKLLLDFHDFRERLSLQGLNYTPEACAYPGDKNMRVNTKRGRKGGHGEPVPKRRVGRPRQSAAPDGPTMIDGVPKVTPAMLRKAKGVRGRLCGDLDKLIEHRKSMTTTKHSASCTVCGDPSFTRCMECGVPCHDDPKRGVAEGRQCFFELHTDRNFGLLKTDCHILKTKQKDWRPATDDEKEKNKRYIENLKRPAVPYGLRSRRGSTTVSPDQSNQDS